MNKHIRDCVKICESNGLIIKSITKGKHIKILSDQGLIVMSSSPSDRRWRYNAIRSIRSITNID